VSKRDKNDARKLREVAAALRDWGRKAGPPGRKPASVPDEERDAARQALLLAITNLEIIDACNRRYGCAQAVAVCAGVFDKLQAAADDHDRGVDLGGYWVWAHDLTGKHLPGNVSFPDRLGRWANRLDQEPAEGGQAGGTEEIINLCDEMLRLGREPGSGAGFVVTGRHPSKRPKRKGKMPLDAEAVPAVGEYKPMSGPSGILGRMGQACDEEWVALAAEFDDRAKRLAVLVKALDSTYDTGIFYSPDPVSVWVAYPKARKMLSEDERLWHREKNLADGMTEAEADAFLDQLDAWQKAKTLNMWTKMQWPGYVLDMPGHRLFLSDPALVHAFDQRFGALREWATERAREERKQEVGAATSLVKPPTGNWSRPMALTDLADRIFKNSRLYRKVKSIYGKHLRKVGPKAWQIDLGCFRDSPDVLAALRKA